VRALAAQAPSVLQPDSEAAGGDADNKLKMAGAAIMQGLAGALLFYKVYKSSIIS
jgi:hypothetical protein